MISFFADIAAYYMLHQLYVLFFTLHQVKLLDISDTNLKGPSRCCRCKSQIVSSPD